MTHPVRAATNPHTMGKADVQGLIEAMPEPHLVPRH